MPVEYSPFVTVPAFPSIEIPVKDCDAEDLFNAMDVVPKLKLDDEEINVAELGIVVPLTDVTPGNTVTVSPRNISVLPNVNLLLAIFLAFVIGYTHQIFFLFIMPKLQQYKMMMIQLE